MADKENPVVSVIIPVYNAGKEIEAAVHNLQRQEYKNIEIILVDDGSVDISYQVCCALADKDERIKVFHKSNGGIASARNYGLNKSSGKYIIMIDQDDVLKAGALAHTIPLLEKTECDVAFFKHVEKSKAGIKDPYPRFPSGILARKLAKEALFSRRFYGNVWNMIVSKNLVFRENLEFNESYRVIDDLDFVYRVLSKCKKALFIPEVFYVWENREGSESHRNYAGPAEDIMALCRHIFTDEHEVNSALTVAFCVDRLLAYLKIMQLTDPENLLNDQLKQEITMYDYKSSLVNAEVPLEMRLKIALYKVGILIPALRYFGRIW